MCCKAAGKQLGKLCSREQGASFHQLCVVPVKVVSILIGSGCWGALGRKGARQRAEGAVMAGQQLTAAACPSSCWKEGRGLPVTTRTGVSKVSGRNSGAPCAGAEPLL